MAVPKKAAAAKTKDLGLEAFRQPAADTGMSLDQLTAAFAEMLTSGDDPYSQASTTAKDADLVETITGETEQATDADEACPLTPRSILEAMLFVGGPGMQGLASQEVAKLMRGVRPSEINAIVRDLNDEYERRGCPYQVVSEGAAYRLALRDEYGPIRERVRGKMRRARLSQAAIEVLSLVAYNQPITGEEVNRLRGTASGAVVSQLVRRQLLRLERSEGRGRRGEYYTTPRFLELFGLASLEDLPRSEELEL